MRHFNYGKVRVESIWKSSYDSILLPLLQSSMIKPQVQIACSLLTRGGSLSLIDVVEVPAELSMDAAPALAGHRDRLAAAASSAEDQHVTPSTRTIKARSGEDAIVETARTEGSDLIILGYDHNEAREAGYVRKVARRVGKRARCDVLLLSFSRGSHARVPGSNDRVFSLIAGIRRPDLTDTPGSSGLAIIFPAPGRKSSSGNLQTANDWPTDKLFLASTFFTK